MMLYDMGSRDRCPTAFRCSMGSAEKVGKSMESRQVDALFPRPVWPIPIAISSGSSSGP
jgi:hypothetical protein